MSSGSTPIDVHLIVRMVVASVYNVVLNLTAWSLVATIHWCFAVMAYDIDLYVWCGGSKVENGNSLVENCFAFSGLQVISTGSTLLFMLIGGAATATIRALTPGEWLHWAHVRGTGSPAHLGEGGPKPNDIAPKMSGDKGVESSPQPLANVDIRPMI